MSLCKKGQFHSGLISVRLLLYYLSIVDYDPAEHKRLGSHAGKGVIDTEQMIDPAIGELSMADGSTDPVTRPGMTDNHLTDEAFDNPSSVQLIDSIHFPATEMQISATTLKNNKLLIPDIKWGLYEQKFLLTDPTKWRKDTFRQWDGSVARARHDMSKLSNNEMAMENMVTIPQTRLELLDTLIQYCFLQTPPYGSGPAIPIVENLRTKTSNDSNPGLTDFQFKWVTFTNDLPPSMLCLMFLCRAYG